MPLNPQLLLAVHEELSIDLFAGGGGFSLGFEMATGRHVDFAVNHDRAAVSMHEVNHPTTEHKRSDVFEVCPHSIVQGRRVGHLHASPDCTYHSKARGDKPIRHKDKKRRALAWVVTRWAHQVHPRVITMENVEEFAEWGPLVAKRVWVTEKHTRANGTTWESRRKAILKVDGSHAAKGEIVPIDQQELVRDPKRKGETYKQWVQSLEQAGFVVEWKELAACDFGAPTIRKRWFCVARCDGRPIVWPSPTHGSPDSKGVREGTLQPFRTAGECIDWSIPMCSVFASREEAKAWSEETGRGVPIRPLAPNTMRRIARGVLRYVVSAPNPYLVTIAHGEGNGARWGDGTASLDRPLGTAMTKNQHALVSPVLGGVGGRAGQSPEKPADGPLNTITAKADTAIFAPMVANVANSKTTGRGPNVWPTEEPLRTITSAPGHAVVGVGLVPRYGERAGQEPRVRSLETPAPTVVNTDNGGSLAAAMVSTYYGGEQGSDRGSEIEGPIGTQTTENRHALVAGLLTTCRGDQVGSSLDSPSPTITANSGEASRPGGAAPIGVVAAHIMQNNEGGYDSPGRSLYDPHPTVCANGSTQSLVASLVELHGTAVTEDISAPLGTVSARGQHHGLVASHIVRDFGESVGSNAGEPIGTITAEGNGKAALAAASLSQYYGTDQSGDVSAPLPTLTTKDRSGLVLSMLREHQPGSVDGMDVVTLAVQGSTFYIFDIVMRMLSPRELYRCQGFPDSYVIDHGADGKRFTKAEQVRMVGNSVSPQVAAALIRANCPELIVRPPKVDQKPRRTRKESAKPKQLVGARQGARING